MPAVPLSEAVADSVATALNGFGLTYESAPVEFTRVRFPTYSLKDVKTPRFHVVPIWPVEMDPHDDNAGTATQTPVLVTIDHACEKTNEARIAELTALLESLMAFLAAKNIDGAGYPIDKVRGLRDEDVLNRGWFAGTIAVSYRVFRNAPTPLPDEDFP